VTDGPFVTGKSAGCAIAFSLALIEKLRGAETAQKISDAIYYTRPGGADEAAR